MPVRIGGSTCARAPRACVCVCMRVRMCMREISWRPCACSKMPGTCVHMPTIVRAHVHVCMVWGANRQRGNTDRPKGKPRRDMWGGIDGVRSVSYQGTDRTYARRVEGKRETQRRVKAGGRLQNAPAAVVQGVC